MEKRKRKTSLEQKNLKGYSRIVERLRRWQSWKNDILRLEWRDILTMGKRP